MHPQERIPDFNDFLEGFIDSMGNKAPHSDDPTPWCSGCGSMTKAGCNCGPIADNE
jgi:hypothetical protein